MNFEEPDRILDLTEHDGIELGALSSRRVVLVPADEGDTRLRDGVEGDWRHNETTRRMSDRDHAQMILTLVRDEGLVGGRMFAWIRIANPVAKADAANGRFRR